MSQPLRDKAVEIACGEKNVRAQCDADVPRKLCRTHGERISVYQASVGLEIGKPGQDYCVAFVYWCFEQAIQKVPEQHPLRKMALVSELYNYAVGKQCIVKDAKKGDVFIEFANGKPKHVGFVRVDPKNDVEFATIEGNTWVNNFDWGVHESKHKFNEVKEDGTKITYAFARF